MPSSNRPAPTGQATSIERNIKGLGTIAGTVTDGVETYRGVPFAQPPVGPLRFALTVACQPWNGVLDCTHDRPMSPQTESRAYAALGPIEAEIGEDSLYLSIWAPAGAKKAPVLVWIHGGGFMTGAGSQIWYDGERMAREHGVVVVCLNYRLGALGYLSLPGIIDGNFGILDQTEALRWVRRHVGDLGGDVDNITVAGESGGAHAIASILALPDTEGMFRRAIMQSPPIGIALCPQEKTLRRGTVFIEALGLSVDDPRLLEALREKTVEDILAAQTAAAIRWLSLSPGDVSPIFVPAAAGALDLGDQDFVELAAKRACERGVEVMIGWTRDEGAFFLGQSQIRASIQEDALDALYRRAFGDAGPQRLDEARRRRPDADAGLLMEEMLTESTFRSASLRFARIMADHGGKVFVYRFDWASPQPWLRACHCADLPFTFGNHWAWAKAAMMEGVSAAKVENLTRDMMSRWASFVKSGTPGVESWNANSMPLLVLDDPVSVETINDPALA